MTLSKYIRDLLFRYECVIVPEFGGFLTKTISATIDKKTQTLHPPTKRLGFNSQLVENDGLLANYIASVEQIPYDAALNFIGFEVKDWQNKIAKEKVVLENIGYFYLNDTDKLQFEPDTEINYLTEAFGLGTLMAPEISRDELLEEEVKFDLIEGSVSDKDIYLNTDSKRKTLIPFFSYAALIAVLLVVGFFLAQVIIKQNKDLNEVAQLEADHEAMLNKRIQEATFEINKTLPAITLRMGNDKRLEENEAASSTKIAKTNQETSEENTSTTGKLAAVKTAKVEADTKKSQSVNSSFASASNRFHIIGGAFKNPVNADKMVRQLKEKGYPASIVGVNKWQLTQVAFGSFATQEEANVFLRKIKNSEAKDAWILVK